MITIGITGGTGSGKTTALNYLKSIGAYVVDCDQVYHRLLEQSRPMNDALAARFPEAYENGRLLRKKLGSIVFGDPAALEDLNGITHPYVSDEIEKMRKEQEARGCRLFAIDAIALLESGLRDRCDVVVGVTAPEELRVGRLAKREGISEEYARMRIAAQKPDSYFEENCDYILRNESSDLNRFWALCKELFTEIIEEKGKTHE